MIKEVVEKLVKREDLSFEEAYTVMNEIMSGQTTITQNVAFLTALATKSCGLESLAEISGFATAMRERSLKVQTNMDVLEIVGTGGDHANSFNISTTSAIVVAASGIKVAKHGNRAASSKSGSADCLEALGVNIQLSPERCVELLHEIGICFFFAQKYHSSMKYVASIRKELGFRTVFNILGPLTNPATPTMQLLGVYDPTLLELLSRVLCQLGIKRGMVVYGQNRLDEISVCAPTSVCDFQDDHFENYEITPEQFGLNSCTHEELLGGTADENAKITLAILNGERGAKRNAVLMNAGAALYIGGKAVSIQEGVNLAAQLIDSGKAVEVLNKFVKLSNKRV